MKALEILNKIKNDENDLLSDENIKENSIDNKTILYIKNSIFKLNEAIDELKALENRSCESCKINNVCNIYKIIGSNVGMLVSCKKWESK